MRALVPASTVGLSIIILGKSFSLVRKLCLVPIAVGVYVACTGDNTYTTFGLLITIVAVMFAGLKAGLSSKVRRVSVRLISEGHDGCLDSFCLAN